MTNMRAKLVVSAVFPNHIDGELKSERVHFSAVCKTTYADSEMDEDNTYARMSPSAMLTIDIHNPALLEKFEAGQRYYVDFSPVP